MGGGDGISNKTPFPSSVNLQALKKAFVFYLNASGRYLVLREHLREAVTQFVQQRCLDMKKDSLEFKTHRDFHSFLSDMYIHLCDEVHETLRETALQEPDPLDPIPSSKPPSRYCTEDDGANPDAPLPFKEYEKQSLLRDLLFYSEESLAQGDYENCQRLHLQRICVSKEDSCCWTDYALSWLSRGDHRMAEIALKEAICSNPHNIVVLLLGGLMSVLYNDERGIDCLTVALGMKPSCPEIMVILALAYAQLGNEIAADYFFRRAAFFHRVLTGKSTEGIDEKIDELSKSVGIRQSLQNLGKVESSLLTSLLGDLDKNKKKSKNKEAKIKADKGGDKDKVKSGGSKSSKGTKGKKSKSKTAVPATTATATDTENEGTSKKKSKNKSPGKHKDKKSRGGSIGSGGSGGRSSVTSHETSGGDDPQVPPEDMSHQISIELRRFDFSEETRKICLSEVYLPPGLLSPSIRIPWDVTQFDEKMKAHLEELEGKIPTGESKISPDDEIRMEFDKIMEQGLMSSTADSSSVGASSDYPNTAMEKAMELIKRSSTLIGYNKDKKKTIKSSSGRESSETKKKSSKGKSKPPSIVPDSEGRTSTGGKSQRNSGTTGTGEDLEESMEEDVLYPLRRSQEGQRRLLEKNIVENPPPEVYDQRLGSELIWTAQLLLQLRMFDLLDGVLARELLISGKRSLQFLYFRGMSNYMRQKQSTALAFFEEGLNIDPDNAILWIMKGHCLYETGDHVGAAVAYEKALHLPVGKENRHLMYLRYGTLSLEGGNWEIAKKVFLHGVQKYPTPYMWLAIGNTCYAMREFDQAEVAFAEANRLDNTDPITWAHLSLVNLAQNQRVLAEQSYKWALRFGLKKGKILDEIKRLQEEKGFGDPSFPRVPNCIPHDYFVRRLGRQKPFDMYRDALMNEQPTLGRPRFDDSEREKELKEGILKIAELQGNIPPPPEEPEEEMEEEIEAQILRDLQRSQQLLKVPSNASVRSVRSGRSALNNASNKRSLDGKNPRKKMLGSKMSATNNIDSKIGKSKSKGGAVAGNKKQGTTNKIAGKSRPTRNNFRNREEIQSKRRSKKVSSGGKRQSSSNAKDVV